MRIRGVRARKEKQNSSLSEDLCLDYWLGGPSLALGRLRRHWQTFCDLRQGRMRGWARFWVLEWDHAAPDTCH